MGAILVAVCIYCGFCRKKKVEDKTFLSTTTYEDLPLQAGKATRSTSLKSSDSTGAPGSASSRGLAISVDKSVEFSYEELAKATNDFSIAHKIGQGGFGAVYYAELRGERAAIKKMDRQATREFLAELKVLTHVHHLNLTAEEAMTPIESTFSLDVNSKLVWEAMRKILARGHSRVPVYFRNPKNIIGLLLVKSLLTVRPETETPVSAVSIRRIPRVPADMPLYDILNEFQKGSSHMAAVVRTKGKN